MSQGAGDPRSTGATTRTEHHFHHDLAGPDCLSTAIISALAEVRDVDVRALDLTLHDHVDPDALDAILAPRLDGTPRAGGRVELTVAGHTIAVRADGHFVVSEPGSDRPA